MQDLQIQLLTIIVTVPLVYLALWIADRLRPIDTSWRRRLLFVLVSSIITSPLGFASVLFFPLIFAIDLVLLKWMYCEDWGDAAVRVLIWYGFSILIGVVMGLAIALFVPGLFMVL